MKLSGTPPDLTTMRTLTDHIVPGSATDNLTITVADNPGSGGACHAYRIDGFNTESNPSNPFPAGCSGLAVLFQNGPIGETKQMNGITNEALVAIVIDRMRGFQSGPYSCRENAIALTHLEEALMWLQKRTRDRIARGVEGKLAR